MSARLARAATWWSLVAVLGCGGPRVDAPRESAVVDLAPRPVADARYEILHRETRRVDREPTTRVQTRTLLEILSVAPDGSRRARARVFRRDESAEDAELHDEVVTFALSPTGEIVGDPERECGGIDSLRVGRYLRHLVSARAFVADGVGAGSRWRGEHHLDVTELSAPAVFELDDVGPRRARGRMLARAEVEEADLGEARVTGTARVRAEFTVSVADGFVGQTDLRTRFDGVLAVGGSRRRGTARTRSKIVVRRDASEEPMELACDAFDPATVTRAIGARVGSIQRCYERELRSDATLRGRVMVRFNVGIDGRVRGARITENGLGSALVGECLVGVVSNMRFRPAPVGGSVSMAYPFVFAPTER